MSDWLLGHPWLSKGEKCRQFETEFAKWIGSDYAVYVNSGSSANLLVLSCLNEFHKTAQKKKIVVPALSWATDLAPVMQLGMTPLLCDCNLSDLSVDLNKLEDIFKKQSPFAIMMVSVLGLVPDMAEVCRLCAKYNVLMVEDTCESVGSKYRGRTLGTFGVMSTFSFYYSHHISSVEGGMVTTNSVQYYNLLCSMRSHGWARDCEPEFAKKHKQDWHVGDFDEMFTFYYPGFNLRSTEMNAFLGLGQLAKLDKAVENRNAHYIEYDKTLGLNHWRPAKRDGCYVSPLAYPLLVKERDFLYNKLRINEIETRPIIAGNLARQPMFRSSYGEVSMPNADIVHTSGIYLPCNSTMSNTDINRICRLIGEEFVLSL